MKQRENIKKAEKTLKMIFMANLDLIFSMFSEASTSEIEKVEYEYWVKQDIEATTPK